MSRFINLDFPSTESTSQADRVFEYAKETLFLGMLMFEFKDAIKEGDGRRVLRCWKYFFLLFRSTGHKNYCIEALNLLAQYYYTLPPQLAEQMLWGRFINTHGRIGKNFSCDLHMEHLNRMCKDAVNHLGANKIPQTIVRVGKALGPLTDILEQFDRLVGVHVSGSHTCRSNSKDMHIIVEELRKRNVFDEILGRNHHNFNNFRCNQMITRIDRKRHLEEGQTISHSQ